MHCVDITIVYGKDKYFYSQKAALGKQNAFVGKIKRFSGAKKKTIAKGENWKYRVRGLSF